MTIEDKENELFAEWEAKYQDTYPEKFVRDGAIDGAAFCNSKLKIVFMLKEANEDNGTRDLRTALPVETEGYHTWGPIACWANAIRAIWSGEEPEYHDNGNDPEYRHKELKSVCVMNVKKVFGGAKAYDPEVKRFANEDKGLILRQLEIYSADVVITCGKGIVRYPKEIEMRTVPDVYLDTEYGYDGKTLIINYYHPVYALGKPGWESLVDALHKIRNESN
jgi:hypothetical protein